MRRKRNLFRKKIKSSAAKIFQRRRNFTVPDGNVCFLELQVVCLNIFIILLALQWEKILRTSGGVSIAAAP